MEYKSLTIPKTSITRSDTNYDFVQDLIIIEARHVAARLSEESMDLEELDYGVLDLTSEPNWAPELNEINTNQRNSISQFNNNSQISEPNWAPELNEINTNLRNSISEFSNNSQISTGDSISHISKNAKQMLDNLSDILNCTHRSEEQKSEGKLILNTLIDLLNNSVEVDSDDSGHSSIGHKSPQRNLSEEHSPKPTVKINKLINSEDKANNNSLTVTKQKYSSTNIMSKFKSKSFSCDMKKGPLKALFPVEKMIKPLIITPENKKTSLSMKSITPFNVKNKISFSTSTPNQSPIIPSASRILKPIRGTRVETTNKTYCDKPRRNSDASIQLLKKSSGTLVETTNKTCCDKRRRNSDASTQLLKKPSITTPKLVSNCIPVRRNSISEGMTNKKLKSNYNNALEKETGIGSGLRKVTTKITNSISARNVSFKMKKNQVNISS